MLQCQLQARRPPSPLVFFHISTHFTATHGVPSPSPALQPHSFQSIRQLSCRLSLQTYKATYAPFTPNHSGERSPPTYYRGCWHVVSRDFLVKYRHSYIISYIWHSSFTTEFYDPKTFITHAALLGQGCPHCRKFLTAASRRSLGRVSVPMWLFILSDQLCIIALVGFYLTN